MYKRKTSTIIAFALLVPCLSVFQVQAQQVTTAAQNRGGAELSKTVQRCELTLSDAPTVRGIRFEMSKEEAENTLGIKMLNNSTLSEDREIGLETLTFFRNLVNKYPTQLDGLEFIELKFFGNKLYSFVLSFDSASKWENITDFTAWLSTEIKLPQNWRTESSSLARMNCLDFAATANIYFLPEVSLTNVRTAREIESRRNEVRANQQTRVTAKPGLL
jgi:hypothetical protein